jgi:hypothetical protein
LVVAQIQDNWHSGFSGYCHQLEEITMLHYEMSKALAQQHICDLLAEARLHSIERSETSQLKGLVTQILARIHIRGSVPARQAVRSMPGASPMGCRT